jgi:hypothetical protein
MKKKWKWGMISNQQQRLPHWCVKSNDAQKNHLLIISMLQAPFPADFVKETIGNAAKENKEQKYEERGKEPKRNPVKFG